jgi:hypothetical protein
MNLPQFPHLPSALLGHTDLRVADKHYKRTTSLNAGKIYAELVEGYLTR